ncbi:MAG: LuxR C-terminal-related transcriptional regulator [Thermomicrobiales bacterium]
MPRLSKDHLQALAAVRAIAARPLMPERLAREVLIPLKDAIGWDGYRLFGVDSGTLLINRLLSASDNDRAARREWLEEVYLDERTLPYLRLPEILRARLKAAAYQPRQEHSWGYPAAMLEGVDPRYHWTYYFESESPVGGTLHAAFESGGRQLAVLQAYRRDPNRSFRPKDVSLMQAASPVIGQALGSAFAREQAFAAASESPASGIIFLTSDHSISFATPAGREWLRHLGSRELDELLPTALWSATKGLAEQQGPALRVRTMSAIGPVTIEASEGGDGATAIVVMPERPEAALEPPEHWGLTPQQNQIALQIISGASNRETAERLFLSEHTVEWHLRQIYRALNLSSRTQLQARFFRDVGLARFQDPDPPEGQE